MQQQQREFVFGASGFIGRHLAMSIKRDGCLVGSMPTPQISEVLTFSREFAHLLRQTQPTVIYHLGGSGSPRGRGGDRMYHAIKNVELTRSFVGVLQNVGYSGVVVYASSAAVYGNTSRPARELDPPRPLGDYGLAKLGAERSVGALDSVVVARLFQVFGVGQDKLVVHDLADRIVRSTGPLHLQSSGTEIREFIDVAAAVAALRFLATLASDNSSAPAVFNVASGHATTISDLARRLLRLAGRDGDSIIPSAEAWPNAVPVSVGDPTKLAAAGHRVPPPTDDELLVTMEWVRERVRGRATAR